MNLENIIQDVKTWHRSRQKLFLDRISKDIPTVIRGMWASEEMNCEEKLDVIKWINEFHHRVDNLSFEILRKSNREEVINLLLKHAMRYSLENERIKREIE